MRKRSDESQLSCPRASKSRKFRETVRDKRSPRRCDGQMECAVLDGDWMRKIQKIQITRGLELIAGYQHCNKCASLEYEIT